MSRSLTDLADVIAEDFLAAVFEAVAQPVCVVDAKDVIRFANPPALAALGYDRADELLGRDRHETIHSRHADGTAYAPDECPLRLALATGETVRSELDWFSRSDGSMVAVCYVAAPLAMSEGRGAVVAFTDLEDRRRAQQVLREHDAMLAKQLASLRRVAALVADGSTSAEVFNAIAREVAQLLGMTTVNISRDERDGTATVMGSWSAGSHPFQPGTVAAPIVVGGKVWGRIGVGSSDREPLPDHIGDRLAEFTELVATAIANAESRAGLARLAEEQAALRRVATLIATDPPPAEVFVKVADELANMLGAVECLLVRDEGDGSVTVAASRGAGFGTGFPVGMRLPVDGNGVTASVLRTGRPWRTDDYSTATGVLAERAHQHGIRSAVGAPIRVAGRIWGVIGVARSDGRELPPDTEVRIAQFTELVATAIGNATARAEIRRLADEQAALRRVATLVAQGASPTAVFDAVAAEMERLLEADEVWLSRYEPGEEITVVAQRSRGPQRVPPGTRISHAGQGLISTVRRTQRPARVGQYQFARGAIGELARTSGLRAAVGAPLVVEGRPWGAIVVGWLGEESPPADTEERMAQFAQLLDTAIANADSRAQLTASRARLLTEADEARRRVVRDLHDGAQQRQVHTIVTLKLAQEALRAQDANAESLVAEALEHAEQAQAELRELAHGILPAALTRGGLQAGVEALVARLDLPVEVEVPTARFPAEVEASAYFIVAEALTNVVKHAHAARASVTARVEGGILSVQVRDDGVGGARSDGSGLLGLADRLAVLDGRLRVESPPGGGTLLAADIPIPD